MGQFDIADAEISLQSILSGRCGHDNGANGVSLCYVRRLGDSLLGLGPGEQDLFWLHIESLGDGIDGLVYRTSWLGRKWDQARVAFRYDVVVLHVGQEWLGRLDHIRVEEDLVDNGFDVGDR